jgi:hypothetical protein
LEQIEINKKKDIHIEMKDKQIIELVKDVHSIMKIAIDQEAKVAVMTDNDSTKHVVRILKRKRQKNSDDDDE